MARCAGRVARGRGRAAPVAGGTLMPTIIDALVVELGLNPEPFVRGQKTALAEFKRLKTEASGEVREVEDKARATVTLLGRIQQQALGLGGLLLGGLGLADLVTRFIPLNVELARNAENLGMSARRLAGWEAAAQSVGAPVGSF